MNLEVAVNAVQSLRPGMSIEFTRRELKDIGPAFPTVFPEFTPEDWILENIVGSAYEFSYRLHLERDSVKFSRRATPLPSNSTRKTYVSPDKRHLYQLDSEWLWEFIG